VLLDDVEQFRDLLSFGDNHEAISIFDL